MLLSPLFHERRGIGNGLFSVLDSESKLFFKFCFIPSVIFLIILTSEMIFDRSYGCIFCIFPEPRMKACRIREEFFHIRKLHRFKIRNLLKVRRKEFESDIFKKEEFFSSIYFIGCDDFFSRKIMIYAIQENFSEF